MGTLTFLFESLYTIPNNLLQPQKLPVNCRKAAVPSPPSTAALRLVWRPGSWGGGSQQQQRVWWIDGCPLVPDGLCLHWYREQTKPFTSKYSIFFGLGPSLSCFSILPSSKTNTREPHVNLTYFYPDLHIPWVKLSWK